jgi:putative component of membrane protein insertase Oxa1/YidC/SpoIIIJ protein YidD
MLLGWIGYYQRHIAVNSVQRCPFALSCSRYAQDRIGRLGLYGVLLFIDRYFYRETVFARQTYPYTVRPDGTMALDDGYLELE